MEGSLVVGPLFRVVREGLLIERMKMKLRITEGNVAIDVSGG